MATRVRGPAPRPELTQASRRYLAVQATVRAELRTGVARMTRAREVLRVWDEQVIESLQIERRQAETAYEAGETPLLRRARHRPPPCDRTPRTPGCAGRTADRGDRARPRDRPELRVPMTRWETT